MKKILSFVLCVFCTFNLCAKTWDLGNNFTIDVPDTIDNMLRDLGYTEEVIQEQLSSNGINLEDYAETWSQVKDQVEQAMKEYSSEFENNEDLQGAKNIIPTVKDGFNNFADVLVKSIQDSSSLQNTESSAWIGKLIPGFHFRLGVDTSVATLDIDPLLKMTSALGYDFDLSGFQDTVSNIPIIGNYNHHVIFPTVALNARLGGVILPFDVGFSIMSIDSRGNIESFWPTEDFNVQYLTFGADFRYKFFRLGTNIMNIQISGLAGLYHTSGSLDVNVDQGSANFDFSQTTGSIGVQASGHLLFVDAFVGTKLVTNIKSNVSLKAKPNWRNILGDSISDENAMDLAVALMPSELGFEKGGGWAYSFGVNPVLYGGIGLSAKVMRLGLAASYNIITENLGATLNVRLSW